MSEAPLMVSVSGLRGVVGRSLTPPVACRFAAAFGQYLKADAGEHPHVVFGRDSRPSGNMVERAAIAGLLGVGCGVSDLGIVTTPSVAIMIDQLQADGGMVATASHNPIMWNGLKPLTREGVAPPPDTAGRIIDAFEADRVAWAEVDAMQPIEADSSTHHVHVERVLGHVDVEAIRKAGLKVVLDSVCGAGGPAGAMLLEQLGVELVHLNRETTGRFPHPPEPTAANLTSLSEAIAEHGGDVAFAQDPDADRLAVVDETGRYIGEEYSLALCALAVFERPDVSGPVAVANLSTSRMIDDLADRFGGTVHRSAVGEANVAMKMRQHQATIGGEGNGGVIYPKVGHVRDSLSTMALVLELMARRHTALSHIVAEIPAYTIVKEKLAIQPGMAEAAIEQLAGRYAGQRIDLQDGIRVDTDAGWLHVRPSNTEPILRIIAEASDASAARRLVEAARDAIGG